MKKVFRPIALAAFAILSYANVNAQADTKVASHSLTVDIPEVALLDIEGGTSVLLEPAAPTEAGNPIDFTADTDNSLWLNYSSTVGTSTDATRKVSVAVTGTLPTGSNLKVQAGTATSDGAGTKGTSTGLVTLAAVATSYDVITGIGSCYTGNGASKGHNLTYSLTESSADYSSLNFETVYTVTLTYTLSDN